jgi:hypothetical protein
MIRCLTLKAVFFLLALISCSNALPQQHYTSASKSLARLPFGQSIAFSDFDADGLIDEARMAGSGLHRRVEIVLSRSQKLLLLHIGSKRVNHGSLFAEDVDDDGATDLIWTDLLHADDVVVWMGDGAGQFATAPSRRYGAGFTLDDTELTAPGESNSETAIDCETDRSLDQLSTLKCVERMAAELPNQRCNRTAASSPVLGQPTDRGPPFPLA